MLRIRFLGHACFALDFSFGTVLKPTRLVIDPYSPNVFNNALNLKPVSEILGGLPDVEKTFVVTSHDHADHNGMDAVPNALVDLCSSPFHIQRIKAEHDEYAGRRFGGYVDLLRISTPGNEITVLHASDIGSSPKPELIDEMGDIDILLLPLGGFFTIGYGQALEWVEQIRPNVLIPMHYLHAGGTLPLSPIDPFLPFVPFEVRRQTHWDANQQDKKEQYCKLVHIHPLAESS